MQTLRLPLWRRNQFTIILTIFVTLLGFYFVTPFLPLYLQDLGVADPRQAALWAGLTLGVAPLLTSIASPFWGMMADRYGYKLMLQRSLVLFVLITVLMGLARHPWQLFVLRAAHGLLGGFGALSMTLVSITAPQDRMSEAMSMVQSARVLGAAVGPIMGGVLADSLGIRYSFFVTAGMCALALLIITWGARTDIATGAMASATKGGRPPWRVLMGISGFSTLLILLLTIHSLGMSLGPVLPLYVLTLGVPTQSIASVAGLAVGLAAVANALAALAVGRWGGRYSMPVLLLMVLASGALWSFLLAAVMAVGPMLALVVLLGMTSGSALTLAYTIGAYLIPEGYRGIGIGVLTSATMLGAAIGPFLAGGIATVSLRSVFLVNSGLYLCAALGAFLFLRKQRSTTCQL